ncbi:hypothetical protein UA08_03585 [Talaromyces atroroseus]|uniref:Zn(2)-C6 fungal-type domain-containing protein n=1 Tax=Talaromyces atroroseus TaxID=1441469 RepID=A0A225AJG8_TALAT|nr:hypothetical protein UA08_03585 [Talaromyces atroroseus]OKL61010.1 hypothetical protein UA08_03585 [Talaromyces atroroseus]
MDQFQEQFPEISDTASGAGFKKGLLTAMIELGAFLGALNQGWLADKISRKWSIMVAVLIFIVGSAVQTGSMDYSTLAGGRFIGGVGIGMLAMVAPLYISEIAPPEIRGTLLILQELSIVTAIVVAFYTTYGTRFIDGPWSWRLPFLIQMIPAVVLAVGVPFIPYSPRWLVGRGRDEEALAVLCTLRSLSSTDERVLREWCEIRSEAAYRKELSAERHPGLQDSSYYSRVMIHVHSYLDCFRKGCWKRTHVGIGLMFFQQFAGVNALIYYSPSLFAAMGLDYEMQLDMSGVLNILQMAACFWSLWGMDRLGRRPLLLGGATCMAAAHLIIAALMGKYQNSWPTHRAEAWGCVAMLFFFMLTYGASWGPIPWAMPAEVFPASLRAKGVAFGTMSNWFNNFIIGLITPPLIQNTGYGAYVFFCVFCVLAIVWVWFVVPETNGRTLEEMDHVFQDNPGELEQIHPRLSLHREFAHFPARSVASCNAFTMSSKQRKHVTTACIPCRESKVKCNGATPSCSYCLNKGRACHYQVGGDKRKLSLRFAIELLTGRVDQLSQYILDNGLPIPAATQENELALRNTLESVGLGHLKLTPDIPLSQNLNAETTSDYADLQSFHLPELDTVSPSLPGGSEFYLPIFSDDSAGVANGQFPEGLQNDLFLDQLWNFVSDDMIQPTSSNPTIPPTSCPEPQQEQGGTMNGEVEEIEELVNQLSERMGSLQVGSDGRVRFYGPTSHFNLMEMPAPDNLTIHRTVRKDGLNLLGRLGIDKEVPQELEDHLINLYFTWHNPSFYVVDRGMYIEARKKWRVDMEDTPYYSEALTNAMCCLGAAFVPRYHPEFVTYPKSVSDFFADRAKALLDIELDLPCVATIQAMVVLSAHDIGCKRDARGWLYSGMAVRLSFDLGLHIDMSPHVAEESISPAEAELRRIVFWGTYTTDHLWGFFLGRPFRINMEDVTVEKPGHHLISESIRKWSPYGLPESGTKDVSITDVLQLLSEHRVKLCEIMAPLGHALYGWSQIPGHTLQSLSERSTSKLLQWKQDLPLSLRVDLDDTSTMFLPHVLLLHMQYYQAIIHVHRPWMSKHHVQPPQGKNSIHARRTCINAGMAIANLLKVYEKQYTFRRMGIQAVSITCSAALMLIFASVTRTISSQNRVQEEKENEEDHEDYNTILSVCFRALEEFSLSWESAKRAQTFLTNLQRLWEARANAYNSSKRVIAQSRSRPQSQAPGPKRSRMSANMLHP